MAYGDYGGYSYVNGILDLEKCDKAHNGRMFHSLAGDEKDEILIGLYKQSHSEIFIKGLEFIAENHMIKKYCKNIFKFKGIQITIIREETDNYYQYAEVLVFKDEDAYCNFFSADDIKTAYHGFSGYGVGKGLEDSGYGFDTFEIEERLFSHFEIIGEIRGIKNND